jgi:hypothetical protein
VPASGAGAFGQGALGGREQLAFTGEAIPALLGECVRRARAVLLHPRAWWPWWRSGVGPLLGRRRLLARGPA